MHSRDHMMKKRPGSSKPQQPAVQAPVVRPSRVEVGESINVKDFANLIKREVNEVIKALFMLGVMVTINQDIDFETAELVGTEFDVEVVPLRRKKTRPKFRKLKMTRQNVCHARL